MTLFHIDRSRFPVLVLVAREARSPTDEELDELFALGEALLDADQPYTLAYAPPSILYGRQRRRYAAWLDAHRARISRLNRGTALILPSALLRGVLRAVTWLTPSPAEVHVCASLDEALTWCEARARTIRDDSRIAAP